MLYERWRQIAEEFRNEIALSDAASGQRWTFEELAARTEQGIVSIEPLVFPKGNSPEFIFNVLRAWRSGKTICPLDTGQAAPVFSELLPSGCVHLKLTSGSTGTSRAVAFKPEQLVADAANIVQTMRLRRDSPNIGVISLAHSYGFSNLVLPLLLHGIPLILVPAPLPEIVRRAIGDLGNVTLAAVPALWRVWHDADAVASKVLLAISAGAPLPLVLESAVFERFGLKIHNFYGSSECGGIAYDRSELPRTDNALVGEPMEDVNLSVGEDGCLEVRSRAVGETYWPEGNEKLKNGVFRTSDLAEISNGNIYLRGRITDQINVAGRKISPETIERALLKHPDVEECLVFGVPSAEAERSETIVGCVAARTEIRADALKQFLLTELPAWQIPRGWWFVDALQTNARGKLSRAEWRKRYLARS
ncbi:MAG: long-chain fatty acid--CoA ligase [Verrucomicrobia bacterium]|nr:long-chain fatty acid--CoA ligase [Verrucomicrobiota bacterium]